MNEPRYAWSDAPEQVLLCPYGRPQDPQYRFSPQMAKEVYVQLGKAIKQAEQTRFLRWWQSFPLEYAGTDEPRRVKCGEDYCILLRVDAEALFNQIRSAQ